MKLLLASMVVLAGLSAKAETLTIYTDRPTERLQPLADKFKAEKGVEVVIVEKGYDDLANQIEADGAATPADLLFTKDIVYLSDMTKRGLLQPLSDVKVQNSVIPAMRDPNNNWVAVTFRARTMVYDPSRVDASELSDYEDLADAKWAGRICLRGSRGTYNVALLASFIHHKGETAAKNIMAGILDNMAADVFPNDIAMMNAIANGVCDVGISNTYYLGQVLAQNPNFPIKPFFANQNTTGVHVNGSGIGIVKHSKKAALAQEFIALLLTKEAQLHLSSGHMDYPAAVGVTPNTLIADWGTFKVDATNWSIIGDNVPAAKQIIKELDYK